MRATHQSGVQMIREKILDWLLKADNSTAVMGSTISQVGAAQNSPYTSRTARNLAGFGYMNNITEYRAVKVLTEACASIEWKVFSRGAKRIEQPTHPIALLLAQPNSEQARSSFITELISYWLISGTNYMLGSFPAGSDAPKGLYNLRPDLTEPWFNQSGEQLGWKYTPGKDPIYYPSWKVKTIKFFHPLNSIQGLSPIQVAASVIERQNSGEEWNYSLLK